MSMPLRQRPGTVIAAAVLLFVTGALGIVVDGVLTLGAAALVDGASVLATYDVITSTVYLVTSVLGIVVGVYVLLGRRWAWITAIVVAGLQIAVSLFDTVIRAAAFASGDSSGFAFSLPLFEPVIIVLLAVPSSRAYFQPMR